MHWQLLTILEAALFKRNLAAASQKPQSLDTKDLGEPETKIAVDKSRSDLDMIEDFRVAAGAGLGRATHSPSDSAERKADSVKAYSRYLPGEWSRRLI